MKSHFARFSVPALVLVFALSAGISPASGDDATAPTFGPAQGAPALEIPPELEAIASQKPLPATSTATPQAPQRESAPLPQPPAAGTATPPAPPSFAVPPPPPSFTPGAIPPPRRRAPTMQSAVPVRPAAVAETAMNGTPGLFAAGINQDDKVGEQSFSDMPLNDILDMLQNLTGKSVLRQNSVAGNYSFKSNGAMTRRQAVDAIVNLLAINGVSITPLGTLYLKAVPATSAASNAPYLIEDSTLQYEASQAVCSKLFPIDFMAVPEAVTALSAMQSGLVGTSVIPFEKNRSILATDCVVNLQRMETLLSKIDKPSVDQSSILFFQLKNLSAKDAAARAQQMLSGSLAPRFQGNTTVDSDERTNQLIVYTHRANVALIQQLVDNLDKDVEPLTRTEMFNIHHADVTELCDVIKEVITGQKQVRSDTSGSSSKAASAAQANRQQQRAQQVQQAAQAVADNSGTQFSNYITIVPDERSNTLVATGTQSDIKLLSDIIAKLDAILPQVRIEVVIAEVTLTKNQFSGLESFGVQYGSKAPDGALSGDVTSGNGMDGGNKDVWLSPVFNGGTMSMSPVSLENFAMSTVFKVAKTNSNVKVLSSPNIVTTHNREASIIIGSKEPVVSSYSTAATSTSDQNVANIQYQDVALELTVKPLIGSNGVVQMEITQKINEVSKYVTIAGYGDQPVIGTREASSFVTVSSGKMVILGGLQKVTDEKTHNKVFILGDIPLLGRLFQPKTDKVTRTELIIFIRPVVILNPDEADADAKKKIAETAPSEDIDKFIENGNFRNEDKNKEKKKHSFFLFWR
jgi:general secretion pathway protein D